MSFLRGATLAVTTMPSTAIRRLSYSPDTSELSVTFTSGRRYVYAQVPPEVHAAFSAAPSRGTFFNHRVRDRFAYRELPSATRKHRSDVRHDARRAAT
jgi:hypothetical protein